jgi:hypothetical protein
MAAEAVRRERVVSVLGVRRRAGRSMRVLSPVRPTTMMSARRSGVFAVRRRRGRPVRVSMHGSVTGVAVVRARGMREGAMVWSTMLRRVVRRRRRRWMSICECWKQQCRNDASREGVLMLVSTALGERLDLLGGDDEIVTLVVIFAALWLLAIVLDKLVECRLDLVVTVDNGLDGVDEGTKVVPEGR